MEIFDKVKAILADSLSIKESEITPDKTLADLGADSLDAVNSMMEIEKAYNIAISDHEMEKMKTVQDIVNYLKQTIK